MFRQFVPGLILDNQARDRRHGRFEAIAMFVDISGFSALSDRLIQYGREGSEALTVIINRLFDPVIAEVYARGGFISTFAGDAFTALFPLTQPEALGQAIAAAWNIQKMMAAQQHLETRVGTFSLAVKIGLDRGEVTWGVLGKENARAFYFRGPAIAGCAHAESLARPGEIICSAALWKAVERQVHGVPRGPAYLLLGHDFQPPRQTPAIPAPTTERLAPFVPDAILDLRVAAEFRNLCSVFIAFDDPETLTDLDAFVTATMSLAAIYGGYFNKIDFGDKGNVILILFGAPVSYENNVERAAGFLQALRDQGRQLPWRAGVTFGAAYAGLVGGEARCEYTAIGDVVNLSSRLMSMAGWGEIWTDARVMEQLAGRWRIDSLGRRRVKGKQERIPLYRLVRPTAVMTSTETGAFWGREQELADLQTLLSPLFHPTVGDAPRARFIQVLGEAGVGKTRLLAELRKRLRAQADFRWLRCAADDILRQSLNPFIYGMRRFFGQSPEQSPEENRTAFDGALTDLMAQTPHNASGEAVRTELQRTRSMLAALLDIHCADSLYDQLEPQLRFENVLLAIINFFKALSLLKPLVIELDGGHLLDEDSRTLLQRMVIELAEWPIAVLVASRDEAGAGSVMLSGSQQGVWKTLHLGPLSQTEVQAMAADLLGGELTPAAAHILYAKTSGNPLFVEQLVQDLRERGVLTAAEKGRFALSTSELAEIPATIDAVLIARLDRLAPPIEEVVQTASVLGLEFETPILAAMATETDALPQLLRAAETERIWRGLSDQRYAFVQALLRDVAYHMQLGTRLRRLHRLAAQAYERLYASDLSPHYADLAYHFEKGEAFDKAAAYLRKAGDQAREAYQNEAALSFYERLLAYVGKEEQAQIHAYRGDIFYSIGAYDDALSAYDQALKLGQMQEENARALADIARRIASVYVDKGAYDTAQEWLDRAHQWLGSQESPELARTLLLGAGVAYRQGDLNQALTQCETALDVASRIDALPEQAHGYRLLGTIHTGSGALQVAVEDYQTSLALCVQLGDLRQQSMAGNSLAAVYYYLGQWDKAEQTYLQSLEIAEKIGFVNQQATVANNLGELYLLQGRFADAETQFQTCLRTWQRTGFLLGVALSYRNLAQIAANRQQWSLAQNFLEESLRALGELNSRDWVLAEVYRLLAEVRLAQGDKQAAWAHCHQALAIATEQRIKLVESNVRRVMGQLYRSEGDWQKAETALRESLALAEELGLRYEQGKAWYELALLYQTWEDDSLALQTEARTQARTIFSELNAHWDLARVDALAGPKN